MLMSVSLLKPSCYSQGTQLWIMNFISFYNLWLAIASGQTNNMRIYMNYTNNEQYYLQLHLFMLALLACLFYSRIIGYRSVLYMIVCIFIYLCSVYSQLSRLVRQYNIKYQHTPVHPSWVRLSNVCHPASEIVVRTFRRRYIANNFVDVLLLGICNNIQRLHKLFSFCLVTQLLFFDLIRALVDERGDVILAGDWIDRDLSILLTHLRARTERITISCSLFFFLFEGGFVFPFERALDLA